MGHGSERRHEGRVQTFRHQAVIPEARSSDHRQKPHLGQRRWLAGTSDAASLPQAKPWRAAPAHTTLAASHHARYRNTSRGRLCWRFRWVRWTSRSTRGHLMFARSRATMKHHQVQILEQGAGRQISHATHPAPAWTSRRCWMPRRHQLTRCRGVSRQRIPTGAETRLAIIRATPSASPRRTWRRPCWPGARRLSPGRPLETPDGGDPPVKMPPPAVGLLGKHAALWRARLLTKELAPARTAGRYGHLRWGRRARSCRPLDITRRVASVVINWTNIQSARGAQRDRGPCQPRPAP